MSRLVPVSRTRMHDAPPYLGVLTVCCGVHQIGKRRSITSPRLFLNTGPCCVLRPPCMGAVKTGIARVCSHAI